MKSFLTAAILGLTGLAGAAGANAQEIRTQGTRNEPRHESRFEPRHERNHAFLRDRRSFRPAPRVQRFWVAPRYESVFSGYDSCRKPVYRQVCVSEGYWSSRACD